jgi:hypothetical protein
VRGAGRLADLHALSGSTKSDSVVSSTAQPGHEKDVTIIQSNSSPCPSIQQQQLESQRYSPVPVPQPPHTETELENPSQVIQAPPSRPQRTESELGQQKRKLMPNQYCGLTLSKASVPSVHPLPASKSTVSQHSPFPVRNDSSAFHQMPPGVSEVREDSEQHAKKDCPDIPLPVEAEFDSDDDLYAMPERPMEFAMLKQKPVSASQPRMGVAQQNKQSGTGAIKPISSLLPLSLLQQTGSNQQWYNQSGPASGTLSPPSHMPPSSQTADSHLRHASPLPTTKHVPQSSDPQLPQIFQQFRPQMPGFPPAKTPSGSNVHASHSEVVKPPASPSNERTDKDRRTSFLGNLSAKFEGMGRHDTVNEPPLNFTPDEPPSIVNRGSLLAKLGQKKSENRNARTREKGFSERFSRSASTSGVPNSLPSKKLSRLAKAGLIGGGSGGAQALMHSPEPKNHNAQPGRQYARFDQALSHHLGPELNLSAQQSSTQLAPPGVASSTSSEAPQKAAGLGLLPSTVQQQTPQIPILQPSALQQPIHPIPIPSIDGYYAPWDSRQYSVTGMYPPILPSSAAATSNGYGAYGSSSYDFFQSSIDSKGGSSPFRNVKHGADDTTLTTDIPITPTLATNTKTDAGKASENEHSESPRVSGPVAQVLPREVKLNEMEEMIAVGYEDDTEKEVVVGREGHVEKESNWFEEEGYTMSSTACPGKWEPAYYGWS